ncbi:MAG: tetratricopeptide repeat protein [bacterium]
MLRVYRKKLLWILIVCFLVYVSSFSINRWRAERIYPIEKNFIRRNKPLEPKDDKGAERLHYAADLAPGDYKYHVLLGKYHLSKAYSAHTKDNKIHLLKRAEEAYKKALFYNPSFTEALSYLAWVDFSLEKPYEAMSRLQNAIDLDPLNYFNHIYYGLCLSNFLNRLPDEFKSIYLYRAEEEFKRGIVLFPSMENEPAVLAGKARLCLEKGDFLSAIGHLEKIRVINSVTMPYHIKLARLYLKSNKENKGIRKYEDLLENREINGGPMIIDSLVKEIEMYPENSKLKFLLGMAYCNEKNWAMALNALKEVVRAKPDMAEAHYHMGQLYESLGDTTSAYRAYEKTLAYSKEHPEASKNLLRLYKEKLF